MSSFVLKSSEHSFSFESYLDYYRLLFFTVPLAISFSLQYLSQLLPILTLSTVSEFWEGVFLDGKSSIKFHTNASNTLCEIIICPILMVQTDWRCSPQVFSCILYGIQGPDVFHTLDLMKFQNLLRSSVFANCIY